MEDEEDEETVLTVHVPYVQQQIGGKDCGVFAIAFALHLCLGQELADIRFEQSRMRQHLLRCFQKRKLEGFPQQQKTGVTLKSRLRIQEIRLYCTCRMPDTVADMVQCDNCDIWYHISCVGLTCLPQASPWHCRKCRTQ